MRSASKILVICGAILALCLPASAQALTRTEYVPQAEAICLSNQQAFVQSSKKIAKKLKKLPKALVKVLERSRNQAQFRRGLVNLLKPVSNLEIKLGNSLATTNTALAALVPPPEDAATITSWLASRGIDASNLIAAGRASKSGSFKRAAQLSDQASQHIVATDQLVTGFGFKNCLLSPGATF